MGSAENFEYKRRTLSKIVRDIQRSRKQVCIGLVADKDVEHEIRGRRSRNCTEHAENKNRSIVCWFWMRNRLEVRC
jgi:hypothetical protein